MADDCFPDPVAKVPVPESYSRPTPDHTAMDSNAALDDDNISRPLPFAALDDDNTMPFQFREPQRQEENASGRIQTMNIPIEQAESLPVRFMDDPLVLERRGTSREGDPGSHAGRGDFQDAGFQHTPPGAGGSWSSQVSSNVMEQTSAATQDTSVSEQDGIQSSEEGVLKLDADVMERWKRFADSERLLTDSEVARFLLSYFEDTPYSSHLTTTPKLCHSCHCPLTLICLTCNPMEVKPSLPQRSQLSASLPPLCDDHSDQDSCGEPEPLQEVIRPMMKLRGLHSKPYIENTEFEGLTEGVPSVLSRLSTEVLKVEALIGSDQEVALDSQRQNESALRQLMCVSDRMFQQPFESQNQNTGKSRKRKSTPVKKPTKTRIPETSKAEETVTTEAVKKAFPVKTGVAKVGRLRKNTSRTVRQTGEKQKAKRGRPKKESKPPQPVLLDNGEVDPRPFKCSYCGQGFKARSNCRTHERAHAGLIVKRHKCDQCPAAYRSLAHLRNHKRRHTGERPFPCDQCGKAFSLPNTLKQHMRIHTNECPFICDDCGQGFKQRGLLLVHRRKVHTLERPFVCNICSATFVIKGHLSVHMLSHTSHRPFLCEECGASFKYKGLLKSHRMIHKGVRPFSCDECDKTFFREVEVREHKKRHRDIRNAVCNVCGTAFGSNSCLKRHMQSHTGYRPFPCDQCKKTFATNGDLKVHLRIHSGVRPYSCDVCQLTFITQGNMKKHRNNRHKNAPPLKPLTRLGPWQKEEMRIKEIVAAEFTPSSRQAFCPKTSTQSPVQASCTDASTPPSTVKPDVPLFPQREPSYYTTLQKNLGFK